MDIKLLHEKGFDALLSLASNPKGVTPELAVHLWLIVFMTGVGTMKAIGKLPHQNSQLVGVLELLGGAVFLPGWPKLQQLTGITVVYSYVFGCALIMSALGMVIADPKKRVSPVCWIHAALTLLFVHQQKIPPIMIFNNPIPSMAVVGGFIVYGFILGYSRNVRNAVEENKEKTS